MTISKKALSKHLKDLARQAKKVGMSHHQTLSLTGVLRAPDEEKTRRESLNYEDLDITDGQGRKRHVGSDEGLDYFDRIERTGRP